MILLAACDEHRGIGYQGKLPWHLPEELRHFRKLTLDRKVIVGRTTFDAIGPLPRRDWYVVTSRPVEGATGIDLATASVMTEGIVIGGASIYQQLMPFADRIILSVVRGVYPSDTYFPEIPSGWVLDWEEDHGTFKVLEYIRSCTHSG
jgi:dihydrofolate reductase